MEYYNGILFIIKNEIIPFAMTRMDLEIVISSKVSQRKTNIMILLICRIKKNGTNGLIYKTEIESQT